MSKLVRDKMPDIIKAQGGEPMWHYARQEEYWHALLAKFQEEVGEFLDSKTEADFADVLEIIDAITVILDRERVERVRAEKAARNGTFSKRIILDSS